MLNNTLSPSLQGQVPMIQILGSAHKAFWPLFFASNKQRQTRHMSARPLFPRACANGPDAQKVAFSAPKKQLCILESHFRTATHWGIQVHLTDHNTLTQHWTTLTTQGMDALSKSIVNILVFLHVYLWFGWKDSQARRP